jgi:hypothetical protein
MWARIGVPAGAALFIVALAVSAAVVPELRPLHVFQAFIYVAIAVFGYRGRAEAYGAGVTIAVVWNGLNLFITHLMQASAMEILSWLRTGQTSRVDTMMVFVGGAAHFLLIVACLAAFAGLGQSRRRWRQFAAGGALVLVYFALIVIVLVPRQVVTIRRETGPITGKGGCDDGNERGAASDRGGFRPAEHGAGLLRAPGVVPVHGVRRVEPGAVGLYALVPDDLDPAAGRPARGLIRCPNACGRGRQGARRSAHRRET